MKLTRLIIAAALLAGLGGLVWWSNKQEAAKQANPPADTTTPKVLTLTEGDIRQVEIDHRDGENTVFKRNDANQWQIVGPKTLPTDQSAVGSLTSSLSTINSDRVVDPNVSDLATYGLAPAADTIKITTANGKTTTLLVGDESPSGSVYVKLEADPRLFTVAKFVKDALNKSSKDLRDKRLLTFDSNTVSRVELSNAK
jgi:hypothetical protein